MQSLCSICLSLRPCSLVGYARGEKGSCRNIAVTTFHFQDLLGLLSADDSIPYMSSGILIISSFTYNSVEESFVDFPRFCITFGESKWDMGKLSSRQLIQEHERTFKLWQSVQDNFLKYFVRTPSLFSK